MCSLVEILCVVEEKIGQLLNEVHATDIFEIQTTFSFKIVHLLDIFTSGGNLKEICPVRNSDLVL